MHQLIGTNPTQFLGLAQAVSELASRTSDFEIRRSNDVFQGYFGGVTSAILDEATIVDDRNSGTFPKRSAEAIRQWKAHALAVHKLRRDVALAVLEYTHVIQSVAR